MAENFSISKMVREAVDTGKITYSDGPYGRPLLDSTQAGKILIRFIENDNNRKFRRLLIPGVFVEFKKFAEVAKKVVETKSKTKIKLVKQESTPDFLKTKTKSSYLDKIGFKLNKNTTLTALERNANDYYEYYFSTENL